MKFSVEKSLQRTFKLRTDSGAPSRVLISTIGELGSDSWAPLNTTMYARFNEFGFKSVTVPRVACGPKIASLRDDSPAAKTSMK
jgi:hypothetical protein